MKILIIGCGRTAKAISEKLIELKNIDEFILYSRTLKSSKALAKNLNSKKVTIIEEIKNLKNIDYIIITLSGLTDSARKESMFKSKTTYQVRQDELKFHLGAIIDLKDQLKKIAKKSTIIIVTNPVDELTNYLRIKLNHPRVLGFGLELDAKRYSNLLGKKVLCIGTHGRAIPIINAKSNKEYDILLNKIDSELLSYIRAHGIPHKAAGDIFYEFFKKLNGNKEEIILVSSYIKKQFAGVKNISISIPFKVKKGKIRGIADINVNEIEKKRFIQSAEQLKKSVENILIAGKKIVAYK